MVVYLCFLFYGPIIADITSKTYTILRPDFADRFAFDYFDLDEPCMFTALMQLACRRDLEDVNGNSSLPIIMV